MFDLFKKDDDLIDYMIVNGDFDDEEEAEKEIKRLKNLGLDDNEIKLVIEEGYDPADFEDDEDGDKDDDDYYGEDF